MAAWAGIALAMRDPTEDGLRSRVPVYLHPLAGRPLAWHGLRAMAEAQEPPGRLLLATASTLDGAVVQDLPVEPVRIAADAWWPEVDARLDDTIERVLFIDAAAAALGPSVDAVVSGPPGTALAGDAGTLAVWIERAAVADRVAGAPELEALAEGARRVPPVDPAEDCIVRDRASQARAGAALRDRIVASLMEGGTTFLLPDSVLVDVDVRIGADTVIYPGVTLEGHTTIGAETVVGPGCRIIDSWIGSGVELKGWNYIVGASIRNRAVLEPYVRRGFD